MTLNDLSEKDIERGLWYLRNKAKIRRYIVIFLIVLIFIFFGYSIVKFIIIKIDDYKNRNQLEANLIVSERTKPSDLIFLTKEIVVSDLNTYDLVLSVQNPNERFNIYSIDYRFKYNNNVTDDQQSFILPMETKRLILKDVYSEVVINDFEIEIINTGWKKLKETTLSSAPSDIYTIENINLISIENEKASRSRVEFDVTNDSPYNFAKSSFYVLVYFGTQLIAVDEVEVDNFYSKDKKLLEAGWSYAIPSYANVIVESDTNIFDSNNYISNK